MSLARLSPAWVSGKATLEADWQALGASISVETNIDTGNVDSSSVVITNATTSEPIIQLGMRTSFGLWRHFLFRVDSALGKRPTFRVSEAGRNGDPYASWWRPLWTTDFETWHQFPSFSLTDGHLVFQSDSEFENDSVYIADQPSFRVADATALAASLLTQPYASPTPSANAEGVYFTTVAENDENGRAVGEHPMYAIKLDWGGLTTDGGRKRVGVVLNGIHAGETVDGQAFKGFINWAANDQSQEAQDFRANWILYLYFNLTPNGRYGGHERTNFRLSQDPNRKWTPYPPPLFEQLHTQDAIIADIDPLNENLDAFVSFHCWHMAKEFSYYYPHNLDTDVRLAYEAALTSYEDTTNNFHRENFPSSTNADSTWGVFQGAKLSIDAEIQQRGNSDPARHQQIGSYHIRAIQQLDADGWFVTTPDGIVVDNTQATRRVNLHIKHGDCNAINTTSVIGNRIVIQPGIFVSGI